MWLEFPETSRVINMDKVAEVRIDTDAARGKYLLVIMLSNGLQHVAKEYVDKELAENALCAIKLAVKNNP